MKIPMLLVVITMLAACGSTEEVSTAQQENNLKDEIGYECKMVRRTGSNLPEKVCTTRQQREEAEKKSKEWMQQRAHHGNAADRNSRLTGDGG